MKMGKIKVTEADRKKHGVCEHDHVSYKSLESLNRVLLKRVRSDQKSFEKLAYDILCKNQLIKDYKKGQLELIDKYEDKLEEYHKANEKLFSKNKELVKDNYELTRAYNGLHSLGKFAQEMGVDMKAHNDKLPENNKYDFEQKHTLTESGKVKHKYKLTPKKNGGLN
tara:strand:- start:6 stop:506 length:501 start_codon:yes stop_codon:yes gene_type:complete